MVTVIFISPSGEWQYCFSGLVSLVSMTVGRKRARPFEAFWADHFRMPCIFGMSWLFISLLGERQYCVRVLYQ